MAIDFNGQWKKVRAVATEDEAESIRTLAKMLSTKEGRTFVSNLEPSDAALCIEILDHVSLESPICQSSFMITPSMS